MGSQNWCHRWSQLPRPKYQTNPHHKLDSAHHFWDTETMPHTSLARITAHCSSVGPKDQAHTRPTGETRDEEIFYSFLAKITPIIK